MRTISVGYDMKTKTVRTFADRVVVYLTGVH